MTSPKKRIGVLVLHGMGSQGNNPNKKTGELAYSWPLYRRVLKEGGFNLKHVAWREVQWSHILQDRQDGYLRKIAHRTNPWLIRRFILNSISDAASYRPINGRCAASAITAGSAQPDDTYSRVHLAVDAALGELAEDLQGEGPIIILAHSLGGHIASNHIYDLQKYDRALHASSVRNMETVAAIVTFGCNIPVFVFSCAKDKVTPIRYPGRALKPALQFRTWWYNYYDRNDVLGFPLAQTGDAYANMQSSGALRDEPVAAGRWYQSWNPLSHVGYWRTKIIARRIATLLNKVDAAL